MATVEFELLGAFESHSVEGIRDILDAGYNIRLPIKGKSAVDSLTEMYTRSDRFADCLRLLLERGAVLVDPRIELVLLDDADGLAAALQADHSLISHRTSMVSAFTPLVGVSPLHVAAEFGNLNAARVLLEMGAVVDERASFDAYGLNGHTPLFHTVNSNDNRSAPLLRGHARRVTHRIVLHDIRANQPSTERLNDRDDIPRCQPARLPVRHPGRERRVQRVEIE